MTSTANNSAPMSQNSPRLFLCNGFGSERLATDAEKSLESKKTQLEKFLTQQASHMQIPIKELSLSDCGTTIYVKTSKPDAGHSASSSNGEGKSYSFKIEQEEFLSPTVIDVSDDDQKRISDFLRDIIKDDFKTELTNWSKEAQKEQQDNTKTAVQRVWNEALKHIKNLPRPQTAANGSIETSSNPSDTGIDETSLKINFTKKYITYKKSNGELEVIDLIKNKSLAKTLGIDDAIKAIQEKHKITVLSGSRSCDSAKDLIKKGIIFDTHFLDNAPQEGKNQQKNQKFEHR